MEGKLMGKGSNDDATARGMVTWRVPLVDKTSVLSFLPD